METSAELNELAAALAKAQGQMEGAKKDGQNPHFRSRYSTLASIWEACRKPLADNGLSVVQAVSSVPEFAERITITTQLLHSSGQWMRESYTLSAGSGRPQEQGSACSYGRRYALAAIVGIAPEDDDAEAAEGRVASPSTASVPKPQNKPNGAPAPARKPLPVPDDVPFAAVI